MNKRGCCHDIVIGFQQKVPRQLPQADGETHVEQFKPIASMYGIFTYSYRKNQANVGKYTIHGWYGKMNRTLE